MLNLCFHYIVFHFTDESRMIPCRPLELLALVLFGSYLSFSSVLLRNNFYALLSHFRFILPCAYSIFLILYFSSIFSFVLRSERHPVTCFISLIALFMGQTKSYKPILVRSSSAFRFKKVDFIDLTAVFYFFSILL